jgi:methyl-accepting chemotaxis protein
MKLSGFQMKNIPVSIKLFTSMSLLIVIMIIIGSIGLIGMNRIQSNLDYVIKEQNVKVQLISKMWIDLQDWGLAGGYIAAADSLEIAQPNIKAWIDTESTLISDMRVYIALSHLPQEQAQLDVIKKVIPLMEEQSQPVFELAQKDPMGLVHLMHQIYNSSAVSSVQELKPALEKLLSFLNNYIEQVRSNSDASFHTLMWIMIGVFIIGIVISLLIGWFVTKMIIVPLNATVKVVQSIARGDLCFDKETYIHHYGGKDAFGQLSYAIGDMTESLRKLIANIQTAMQQVQTNHDISQEQFNKDLPQLDKIHK